MPSGYAQPNIIFLIDCVSKNDSSVLERDLAKLKKIFHYCFHNYLLAELIFLTSTLLIVALRARPAGSASIILKYSNCNLMLNFAVGTN